MKTYKQKLDKWHKMYGNLPTKTRLQINKLVNEFERKGCTCNEVPIKAPAVRFTEGTKFVREYNGRKYEVIALAKGFQYKNKIYNSLSAIAYEITKTKWNGKRFFGVCK